ncbi:TlpA disulfide reductase family protein [Pseudonocardia asaccharolytica]|uniref:Alkyl hydroperoxide reductase n=1 Tax=Pseudonocardia asaccharolytica DSM 44247 = NBRC 16224 TaxID=1123024 RepID=A0A511CVC0_9PSEU|nr:TlpA disulfide reductase family protein [Pseudonocardia asaccharolytica]GEL16387.1 alkyl hydroperoxide reductase [Pseudonocardia asaccharolytica DSM 44247 = NBRC 16224]
MIRLLTLIAALLLLAGCATTGKDAVAVGGEFQFVAPGGQMTITYDPPESRSRLPQLSGESLLHPGQTIGVGDHAGKVLVINIWGSWCGPCREEMPDLQFVLDQTRADGVAMMGIDVRDDRAAAADFVRDRGLTFDSIYDPPGRALFQLRGYPRNVVPSTIVLDRRHRVAAVYLTQIRVSELLPLVERLAAEPAV